jgi:hypothetical protein
MAKDSLARGARSANFGSMSHIDQSKWDAMFASEGDLKVSPPKRTSESPTQQTNSKEQ